MVACKACNKEISPVARNCLYCRHPNSLYKQTKISLYEWFVGGLIIITMAFWLIIPPVLMVNGLPSCDTSFSKNLAQKTLKQIPILSANGVFAINLNNIKETASSSQERKCTASVKLSNDTEHTVKYKLTKQQNNHIYLQIQLINQLILFLHIYCVYLYKINNIFQIYISLKHKIINCLF